MHGKKKTRPEAFLAAICVALAILAFGCSNLAGLLGLESGADAPLLQIEYSADGVADWHVASVSGDSFIRMSVDDGLTWSEGLRVAGSAGATGAAAPALQLEYSVDGTTGWHEAFATGDRYIRSSVDGGTTWSAALLVVGATGSDAPLLQIGYSIDGLTAWHAINATGDNYLRTSVDGGATWSGALRITGASGADAPNLQIEYSVDGSASWHASYISGDAYMRTSSDGGTTWNVAILFKGATVYVGPVQSFGVGGSNVYLNDSSSGTTLYNGDYAPMEYLGYNAIGTRTLDIYNDTALYLTVRDIEELGGWYKVGGTYTFDPIAALSIGGISSGTPVTIDTPASFTIINGANGSFPYSPPLYTFRKRFRINFQDSLGNSYGFEFEVGGTIDSYTHGPI